MTNWYCTRESLKASLGLGDALDDAQVDMAIEAVSRAIELHCGRWFYPRVQTRYVSAACGGELLLDADLLAVTTLKADEDADRVYEVTWATTDYDLGPENAPFEPIPRPYWRIVTAPNGALSFPGGARGVQIVGSWGFYDVRRTSSATCGEVLDTSETGVDVSDGTAFEVGQTILVDSEQMFVSEIAGSSLTVERGVNGTTAAAHASGAVIQVYEYPLITQLCQIQAAHLVQVSKAPGGIMGSAELGTRLATNWNPMVRTSLDPFRLRIVA